MNIVGIGLSNIDLISHVSDDFIEQHNLTKGQAKKLGPKRFLDLKNKLEKIHIEAGGCAGNTLCGMDNKKFKKTFFGKIGEDQYNALYRSSFKKHNVIYPVKAADADSSQCAVLITPDGDRTFAYIDGASWRLSPDDLYFEAINTCDMVYTEVYAMAFGMQTGLWPTLINYMRETNKTMAVKLIDHEYIDLYKTALFGLAEEGILTMLVGNKSNVCKLANRDTISETLDVLSKWKCAVLLTDGKNGAHYRKGDQYYHHPVDVIETPNNSSGAGDQFVAGFLEDWLFRTPIAQCMKNADQKARQVLMSDSPRPA